MGKEVIYLILNCNVMRRTSLRLDRLPQPLTLSRKLNHKLADDPNPYRLGEDCKENRLNSSRKNAGLSEMKHQLLLIKDGMIKLFNNDNEEEQVPVKDPPNMLCDALKHELVQMKHLQEKLRAQIQNTKTESSKTLAQVRQENNAHVQLLRREKQTSKYTLQMEMRVKDNEIERLKQMLCKTQQQSKGLLEMQKSKYQQLTTELNSLQVTVKELQSDNQRQERNKAVQGTEVKRVNLQLSVQLHNANRKLQNYKAQNQKLQDEVQSYGVSEVAYINTIKQLETEKVCLSNRIQDVDREASKNQQRATNQINSLKTQIIDMQLTVGHLQEQNYVLSEHCRFMKDVLQQKGRCVQLTDTEPYGDAVDNNINGTKQ